MLADHLVRGAERPPDERRHAQDGEELRGHAQASRRCGFVELVAHPQVLVLDSGQAVERRLHPPPVEERLGRGVAAVGEGQPSLAVGLEDRRQAVVLVERETPQGHGIDHREDRGAGADGERQDADGDGGAGPCSRQPAKAEANVHADAAEQAVEKAGPRCVCAV